MNGCTVEGCDRGAIGRGYCRKHYQRWYTKGDPLACGTPKGNLPAWLEKHKSFSGTECLIWPFCRKKNGVGMIRVDGKSINAPRAMCILVHGQPPSSKHDAAHSCGKAHEGCVNPKHLRWATKAENQADRIKHGTMLFGERNPAAKLTSAQIAEIKSLAGSATHKQIAEKFGVCRQHIGAIINKERWNG